MILENSIAFEISRDIVKARGGTIRNDLDSFNQSKNPTFSHPVNCHSFVYLMLRKYLSQKQSFQIRPDIETDFFNDMNNGFEQLLSSELCCEISITEISTRLVVNNLITAHFYGSDNSLAHSSVVVGIDEDAREIYLLERRANSQNIDRVRQKGIKIINDLQTAQPSLYTENMIREIQRKMDSISDSVALTTFSNTFDILELDPLNTRFLFWDKTANV